MSVQGQKEKLLMHFCMKGATLTWLDQYEGIKVELERENGDNLHIF